MSSPTPKPGIMDITPYKGGEAKIKGVSQILKLSSNENAFGISPKALEAIKKHSEEAFRYPDGNCNLLRDALAEKYQIPSENIVCGAGSDELIKTICNAFAGCGDEVLYNYHGFLMYGIYAKAFGATPIKAPEKDFTVDIDTLIAAVTPKTKIVFLANPNNPTGTMVPKNEIERLAKSLPSNILLVIDAAYAEFIEDDNYSTGFELVSKLPNVAVLRTFSKIYGLGGIRLGFCYCSAAIADILNRVRGPFNVSSLAQEAGIAALGDEDFVDKSKKHNFYWLPKLTEEVNKIGIKTTLSFGNFILAIFPENGDKTAQNADDFLRKNGIITRRMEPYNLPNTLRISIGRDDEMNFLIKTLTDFMNG
ncbi:MAG: histidinol-phosphate transaminase [Alphaproteobacteria bacterium]